MQSSRSRISWKGITSEGNLQRKEDELLAGSKTEPGDEWRGVHRLIHHGDGLQVVESRKYVVVPLWFRR